MLSANRCQELMMIAQESCCSSSADSRTAVYFTCARCSPDYSAVCLFSSRTLPLPLPTLKMLGGCSVRALPCGGHGAFRHWHSTSHVLLRWTEMPHLHGCTAFNAGMEARKGQARQSRREIDSSRFALYIKKKTLYFNLNHAHPRQSFPKT